MIESIIVLISAQNSPGQCLWLQQKADDKSVKQIVHVSFLTDKNMNPKSGKVCNSRYFLKIVNQNDSWFMQFKLFVYLELWFASRSC